MRPIDVPNYDHMLGFKFPNKKLKDASMLVHSLRAHSGGYFAKQRYTFVGAIYESSRKYGVNERLLSEWVQKHQAHNDERCKLSFGCPWYDLVASKRRPPAKKEEQLTIF